MIYFGNGAEGRAPRFYRNPEEIRRDIRALLRKIKESEEMLSVRNVLLEVITEWSEAEPERWMEELEETLCEARESLLRLNELKESLEELKEELRESKGYLLG